MIIFLYLIGLSLCEGNCTFKTGVYYTPTRIRECLNTEQFEDDDEEFTKLPALLQEYIGSYVVADQMLDLPDYLKKIETDINETLKNIDKTQSKTPYDFYMTVVKAFKRLRDPHTLFTPPCYSNIYAALPFAFTAGQNVSSPNDLIITAVPSQVGQVTAYWLMNGSHVDLDRKVITRISLDGKNENLQNAYDVIKQFADEEIPNSKYPHARLNNALQSSFHYRPVHQFPLPNDSILVEYQTEAGGTGIETLEWLCSVKQEMQTFDGLCPKTKKDENAQTKVGSSPAPSPDFSRSLEAALKHAVERKQARLNQSAATKRKSFQTSSSSPSPSPESILTKREILRVIEEVNMKEFADSLDTLGTAHLTTAEAEQRWKDMHSYKNATRKGSSSFSSFSSSPVSSSIPGDSLILIMDIGCAAVYFYPEEKTGYLLLSSFSPDDLEEFSLSIGRALRTLKEKHNAERLVVDVRSNGGGVVLLGMQLNRFLFPSVFPVYGRYEMKPTPTNDELAKLKDEDGEIIYRRPSDESQFPGLEWYTTRVKHSFTRENGTVEQQEYTTVFEMDMSDPETFQPVVDEWPEYPGLHGTPLFDPQHIVIVTDGLCGSTCCCFIKHIQEAHAAKIVGVGFAPEKTSRGRGGANGNTDSPTDSFDAGSFCGGTVYSSDSLLEIKNDPVLNKTIDVSKFPADFNRTTTIQRWTQHAIYSWNAKEAQQGNSDDSTAARLLEFKKNPVDVVVKTHYPIAVYDKTKQGLADIIELSSPYFAQCFDWEVQVRPKECPADKQTKKLFGWKCSNGTFVNETCVFARCMDGYALHTDPAGGNDDEGECVPVKLWSRKTAKGTSKAGAKTLGALFGTFALILIIVAGLMALRLHIKKRKEKEYSEFTQGLLYTK